MGNKSLTLTKFNFKFNNILRNCTFILLSLLLLSPLILFNNDSADFDYHSTTLYCQFDNVDCIFQEINTNTNEKIFKIESEQIISRAVLSENLNLYYIFRANYLSIPFDEFISLIKFFNAFLYVLALTFLLSLFKHSQYIKVLILVIAYNPFILTEVLTISPMSSSLSGLIMFISVCLKTKVNGYSLRTIPIIGFSIILVSARIDAFFALVAVAILMLFDSSLIGKFIKSVPRLSKKKLVTIFFMLLIIINIIFFKLISISNLPLWYKDQVFYNLQDTEEYRCPDGYSSATLVTWYIKNDYKNIQYDSCVPNSFKNSKNFKKYSLPSDCVNVSSSYVVFIPYGDSGYCWINSQPATKDFFKIKQIEYSVSNHVSNYISTLLVYPEYFFRFFGSFPSEIFSKKALPINTLLSLILGIYTISRFCYHLVTYNYLHRFILFVYFLIPFNLLVFQKSNNPINSWLNERYFAPWLLAMLLLVILGGIKFKTTEEYKRRSGVIFIILMFNIYFFNLSTYLIWIYGIDFYRYEDFFITFSDLNLLYISAFSLGSMLGLQKLLKIEST